MARQPPEGPRYASPEEHRIAQRRRRRRGTIAYVAIALALAAAGAALWWNLQPDDERRVDGSAHTSLGACEVDEGGVASATVVVDNASDEYSNYLVEVAFVDGSGRRVDTRNVSILGVRSGEVAQEVVRSRRPVGPEVDCRVLSAFRLFAGAAPRD